MSVTLTTLASFGYSFFDPRNPNAGLIADAAGNLYGTTAGDGPYRIPGTVFELAAGTHAVSTLATFDSSTHFDTPSQGAGLTEDGAGNLYGTTSGTSWQAGGGYWLSSYGTVFEVAAGTHAFSTLMTFDISNGYSPGGLIADPLGNLYGTLGGGANNDGTVFQIAAGTHALSTLATFDSSNGAHPTGLTLDASGNLYGITSSGGANGDGTVFEIATGTHALSTLAALNSKQGNIYTRLMPDAAGNLYGTTFDGGANNDGTIFEVSAGTHAISTVITFNGNNGSSPIAGLIFDASGNLYGTTTGGANGSNAGTVFEVAAGSRTLSTLVQFNYDDGYYPIGTLIADAAGNLYGTTNAGGVYAHGTVFELSPALTGHMSGTPRRVVATGRLTPSLQLTNGGTEAITGDETVQYYLSTRTSLDDSATPLGSTDENIDLQPGGTVTEASTIQLPSAAHPGNYYLLADVLGAGPDSIVASAAIQIVPKVVMIITPGFGVGPGGIPGFDAAAFDNIQTLLHDRISAGSTLDGNTFSEVYSWNSTQYFAQGLLALAAEQLDPLLGAVYATLVGYEAAQADRAANAAAAELDNSLVQNELVDKADIASSGPNAQIIDLIGHSRGANLNSILAAMLTGQGYMIDEFTSLDGFSNDWPSPANQLTNVSISGNVAQQGVEKSANYTVQDGLAEAADNFFDDVVETKTGIPLSTANVALLAQAYPDMKAPTRPSFTYNATITGDGSSGSNGRSNHLNITQLFGGSSYLFSNPDGSPTYEGAHFDDPAVLASVTLGANGLTQSGGRANSQTVPASSGGNFVDGNFEVLGAALRQFQASPPNNPDPGAQALLSLFANPGFLLTTMWDVNGTAALVENGSNTAVQLTETADTSVGQIIVPTGGNETVNFDLSNITAGPGDMLQVLFNDQVLGNVPLQGANAGSYSFPWSVIGTDPREVTFKLLGPQGSAAVVQLDNLNITPAPTLASTIIGDGTAQRSVFHSFTLNFDQAVNLAAGAVTMNQVTTNSAEAILTSTAIDPSAFTITNPLGDGKTWVVTVAAGGALDGGRGDFRDGVYQFNVHSALVTNAYGSPLAGGDQTKSFRKLFGDANGDGKVSNADFTRFSNAFGSKIGDANFLAGFDYNHDGKISNADFAFFSSRFGVALYLPL